MPNTTVDSQRVVDLYQQGLSMRDVGERLGCSYSVVRNVLLREGVEMRAMGSWVGPRPSERAFTPEVEQEIARRYREGEFIPGLAEAYSVSPKAINNALRRQGEPLRDKRQAAVAMVAARDERLGPRVTATHTNSLGYRVVTLSRNHPLYPHTAKGRMLEHRFVMAQSLGRPLTSKETIHHIDGDRTNNAIENLQLRQGKHGKGAAHRCRACGSTDIEAVELGA